MKVFWYCSDILPARPHLYLLPAAEREKNGLNLSAAHIWESFETFQKAYHMFSDGLSPAKGSAVRGLKNHLFFSPGGKKMGKKIKLYNGFSLSQVRLVRDMSALPGLSLCGGAALLVVGVLCLETCVVPRVGGMLFEWVPSESCFLTGTRSSKEAMGLD